MNKMKFKCRECGLEHPWFTNDKIGDNAKEYHQKTHELENMWKFTDEMELLRQIDFYASDKVDRIYKAFDKLKSYKFAGWERIENE